MNFESWVRVLKIFGTGGVTAVAMPGAMQGNPGWISAIVMLLPTIIKDIIAIIDALKKK